MGRIDARVAGRREPVTGSLASTAWPDVSDDQLLAIHPDPDPLTDELVRDRVAGRAEADGRLLVDEAGDAEGDRVRLVGQRVESPAFLGEQLDRRPPGLAMHAGVDVVAERVARHSQLAERAVRHEEVGLGRDEVGLGDLDGALRAALGLGVGRLTGGDPEPVVTTGGDQLGMANADPGDAVDRHRPLVVGQRVRR